MSAHQVNEELLRALHPLARRAASFGPYWWLTALAGFVSLTTFVRATGCELLGFALLIPVSAWLFKLSFLADYERVIECWAKEVRLDDE